MQVCNQIKLQKDEISNLCNENAKLVASHTAMKQELDLCKTQQSNLLESQNKLQKQLQESKEKGENLQLQLDWETKEKWEALDKLAMEQNSSILLKHQLQGAQNNFNSKQKALEESMVEKTKINEELEQ